jgi:hypothetical protein
MLAHSDAADLEATVAALRARGVVFEEIGQPAPSSG